MNSTLQTRVSTEDTSAEDSGKLFMLGMGILFTWMAIMVFFAKPELFQNMFRRVFFCCFAQPSAIDLERRGTRLDSLSKTVLLEQLAAQHRQRANSRGGGSSVDGGKSPMSMAAADLIQAVNHSKRSNSSGAATAIRVGSPAASKSHRSASVGSPKLPPPPHQAGRHRDLTRVAAAHHFETIPEASSGSSHEEITTLEGQRLQRQQLSSGGGGGGGGNSRREPRDNHELIALASAPGDHRGTMKA